MAQYVGVFWFQSIISVSSFQSIISVSSLLLFSHMQHKFPMLWQYCIQIHNTIYLDKYYLQSLLKGKESMLLIKEIKFLRSDYSITISPYQVRFSVVVSIILLELTQGLHLLKEFVIWYRNPHYTPKVAWRPSQVYNENPFTNKMVSP